MPRRHVIRIEGLGFQYPGSDTPAIDDLSLHVRDGVLYGLLGPNGSGKTTLISLVMGLLKPSAGRVRLGSDAPDNAPPRVAFVPQEYAFYPQLSVAENLRFFVGVGDLPPRRYRECIANAVAATALEEFLHTRARRLSGGLKRRLNLAIGLVNAPTLLLLDEPTVGIDPHSRHFILESIRAIHRAGTTVVYTSHYMEEVEAMCEDIGILDRGKLIARGNLQELLGREGDGTLDIRLHGRPDPDWVARLPDATITNDRLCIPQCPSARVSETLAALGNQGVRFSQVRYAQRNLEDLFMDLTGRQLRD